MFGAGTLPESSPAQISVRYSSMRLAPGMNAVVDVILYADVPGKVSAELEVMRVRDRGVRVDVCERGSKRASDVCVWVC